MNQDEESIFAGALAAVDPRDRAEYLDRACAGNPDLRRSVEALLSAFPVGEFLEKPGVVPHFDRNTTLPFIPDAPEVGTVIGPYTLREQLGEGGMGLVYVAEQTQPVRRKVALKVIKPGMDSRQVVARFEAERQALALMDHPNIAKVLDAGTTPVGRPYFVMELVRGEPITAYCDHHRLTLRQRLELFVQVCQAVQHAHQKGVIHRDLKPSNVLIAVHDVAAVAKVIDFGIAKAVGQSLTDKTVYTAVAQLVGTPLYMSPEQAGHSSLDVDTRTDVYALGVMLYELLTGTTPIDPDVIRKSGVDEMRRIIREDEPPRPSARMSTLNAARLSTVADKRAADPKRLAREVRGELDWVVMKCLEKDRNRRYESASALAADVQSFLSDEPVTACPPSTAYRLRKFTRRNKTVLVTLAAVVIALVAGTVVSAWQAILADDSRRLADQRAEEETVARVEAERQRQRAEANFQKALEAVDRMLTRVGDERLRDVPQMTAIRQVILGDAVQFYRQLLAERKDDPVLRFETALALERLGTLYRDMDRKVEAFAALEESRRFLQDLHTAEPDNIRYRMGLARVHERIGYNLDLNWEVRIRHNRQASSLVEPVVAAHPSTFEFQGQRVRSTLANYLARGAEYMLQSGTHEEVEPTLQKAIDLCRDDPGWGQDVLAYCYNIRADRHTRRGDHRGAITATEQAIAARERLLATKPDPLWFFEWQLALILDRLGDYLVKDGRPQEADAAYRRAYEIVRPVAIDFPSFRRHTDLLRSVVVKRIPFCLAQGKRDEAEKMIGDYKPLKANEYVDRAAFHRQMGNAGKALADLDEAVRLDPKLIRALQQRSDVYMQMGDDRAALADLTLAIEFAPASQQMRAYERRGFAHQKLGNLAAARDDYTKSIDLSSEPGNWFLFTRRSGTHFFLGDYPKALADVDKAVGLKPEDPSTITWIGPEKIAACPDPAFREGMLAQADRMIQLTRGAPEAHDARAELLQAMGLEAKAREDWTAAIAAYKRRLGEEAKNTTSARPKTMHRLSGTQALLGFSLLRAKRTVEAEAILRESLSLREKIIPDSWLRFNSLSLLGGSLLGQKKYVDAEPLLLQGYEGIKERASSLPPESPRLQEAAERLVELYEATGRPELAKLWRDRIPLPIAPPPRTLRTSEPSD